MRPIMLAGQPFQGYDVDRRNASFQRAAVVCLSGEVGRQNLIIHIRAEHEPADQETTEDLPRLRETLSNCGARGRWRLEGEIDLVYRNWSEPAQGPALRFAVRVSSRPPGRNVTPSAHGALVSAWSAAQAD